jgi:hypothetical protein
LECLFMSNIWYVVVYTLGENAAIHDHLGMIARRNGA